MNKWVIGIDLSTTITGVAILRNEQIIKTFAVAFDNFNEKNLYNNVIRLIKEINLNVWLLADDDYYIGIEVANFSNPKLTQRFSIYAGMIIALMSQVLRDFNAEFKMFNANAWQLKIPQIQYNTLRKDRKLITKNLMIKTFNIKSNLNEDEYDALAIAYFYDSINSTLEQEEITKAKKVVKMNKVKQQLSISKKINKLLEKKSKLKKATAISKVDEQIEKLKKLNK